MRPDPPGAAAGGGGVLGLLPRSARAPSSTNDPAEALEPEFEPAEDANATHCLPELWAKELWAACRSRRRSECSLKVV